MLKELVHFDAPLVEVYKRSSALELVDALCERRDVIARTEDERTNYFLPNKVLLEIAKQIPVNKNAGDEVFSDSTDKQGEIEAVVIVTDVHTFRKVAHLVDNANNVIQKRPEQIEDLALLLWLDKLCKKNTRLLKEKHGSLWVISSDQLAIGKETSHRLDGSHEHKYEIVMRLQQMTHICGITGDGVNDAPALKKAGIGIAMDDATNVASGASDIVLTEPGLSVIVSAVLTSRAIFQRMKNYMLSPVLSNLCWDLCFLLLFGNSILAFHGFEDCHTEL
ncbi:hypothetical protein GOBAR_DD27201 [Gossypium barbadense]|nr:hypothetical protein GOBAR_DD27201 [Gossypium barbadense]